VLGTAKPKGVDDEDEPTLSVDAAAAADLFFLVMAAVAS
jgi:hypothetical protein